MLAQPYDWVLCFTITVLLFLTLVLILLRPLWQLAMSRPALIIVFSRAIADFCNLCANFPIFVIFYMMDKSVGSNLPRWYTSYANNGFVNTLDCALHMHNLALAVNRAHAMFFPFHYTSFYAKKSNIFRICLFVWLIAFCFGVSDPFARRMDLDFSPAFTVVRVCMATAGLCYATLGCRMIYVKYFKQTMVASSIENDSIRILVVCFGCLLLSALRLAVLLPLTGTSIGWPDVPKTIAYWISSCAYWATFCTEEILLAFLVSDFRHNVKRQFFAIFCCKNADESNELANNTGLLRVISTNSTHVRVQPVGNMLRGMR